MESLVSNEGVEKTVARGNLANYTDENGEIHYSFKDNSSVAYFNVLVANSLTGDLQFCVDFNKKEDYYYKAKLLKLISFVAFDTLDIPDRFIAYVPSNDFYNCEAKVDKSKFEFERSQYGANYFLCTCEVESIDEQCFRSPHIKLKKIIVPKTIKLDQNLNVISRRDLVELDLSKVEAMKIPEETFFRSNILKIVLPESTTEIGKKAFSESNIKEILIPIKVVTLGDMAFKNCEKLAVVRITNRKMEIGELSFYGCNNLKEIHVPCNMTVIYKKEYRFGIVDFNQFKEAGFNGFGGKYKGKYKKFKTQSYYDGEEDFQIFKPSKQKSKERFLYLCRTDKPECQCVHLTTNCHKYPKGYNEASHTSFFKNKSPKCPICGIYINKNTDIDKSSNNDSNNVSNNTSNILD